MSSFFLFQCYGDHRDLHSFPTRRSSDLPLAMRRSAQRVPASPLQYSSRATASSTPRVPRLTAIIGSTPSRSAHWRNSSVRSEEHTSELQSQSNLVCRLLLEKKNKIVTDLYDCEAHAACHLLSIGHHERKNFFLYRDTYRFKLCSWHPGVFASRVNQDRLDRS